MHWPMHSFGERRMQPSTPISASGEWGGKRSSLSESDGEMFLRRRAFFKSAAAPAMSETESIMGAEDEGFLNRIKLDLCAAPEVLHNRKENSIAAETTWLNTCGYLQQV